VCSSLECNLDGRSAQMLTGLQINYVARFVTRTYFAEQQHIDVFEQLTVSTGARSG